MGELEAYASIGSFALAALSLSVAALGYRADRREADPKRQGGAIGPNRSDFGAHGNKYVVQGDGKTVRITRQVEPPAPRRYCFTKRHERFHASGNGVVVQGNGGIVDIADGEEYHRDQ
ncbi:hypothetical protein [Catellatospora paridis]|uniref:hypothetical protein n=1 Tax=Catellatospora paridis TaxID=1617086 RepID=UPI0012D49749|nr:hypothetical protein [Catellatospora paridis]